MSMMNHSDYPSLELIVTDDGSRTLYRPDIGETYHSTKGALSESQYVFVRQGLDYFYTHRNADLILILEVDLGTGLNALLSLQFAVHHHCSLEYTAVEPFPVPLGLIRRMEMEKLFSDKRVASYIYDMHSSGWDETLVLHPYFRIRKVPVKIESFQVQQKYDIIYLDAFSPKNAASVWTPEIYQRLFTALNTYGMLVTYCAKGQVKRDLKATGETLPGANGKREMIRAVKTS